MTLTEKDNQQKKPNNLNEVEDLTNLSPEDRERKLFMQDLNRFMFENAKPLTKIPIMGYKELDLFQLFKEVMAYGGFNEVVKNVGTWSKIWKRLGNFDPSITDSSFRLKKNYERYLLDYEYNLNPESRRQGSEIDRIIKRTKAPESKSEEKKSDKKKQRKRVNFSPYKEIVREKNGQPRLPIILGGGELIIENLGSIIPRAPYVTEKHIWPVGFTSSRYFSSMKDPEKRVKYTSQIVDSGDRPQFIVSPADDPQNPIISHSPSSAWKTVLKRVIGKGAPEETRKNISVSGALRFGLAHPLFLILFENSRGLCSFPRLLLIRILLLLLLLLLLDLLLDLLLHFLLFLLLLLPALLFHLLPLRPEDLLLCNEREKLLLN